MSKWEDFTKERRVFGTEMVRIRWTALTEDRGICDVSFVLEVEDETLEYVVGSSIIRITAPSSEYPFGMVSTLAMFYMKDIIVAPGDSLMVGDIRLLDSTGVVDGVVTWDYRVTLESDSEGVGRLLGYRMDMLSEDRAVLRGISIRCTHR